MNPKLLSVLQLEELALLRRGLEPAGRHVERPGLDHLDEKIEKVRRRLPGRLLSLYDKLALRYPDVVAVLSDGACQGCHCEVSARLAIEADRSHDIMQCEHCGRLLMPKQNAPDYVS